jgi:hypothetical protein
MTCSSDRITDRLMDIAYYFKTNWWFAPVISSSFKTRREMEDKPSEINQFLLTLSLNVVISLVFQEMRHIFFVVSTLLLTKWLEFWLRVIFIPIRRQVQKRIIKKDIVTRFGEIVSRQIIFSPWTTPLGYRPGLKSLPKWSDPSVLRPSSILWEFPLRF